MVRIEKAAYLKRQFARVLVTAVAGLVVIGVSVLGAQAQDTLYFEGFNDDGVPDGRYSVTGGGINGGAFWALSSDALAPTPVSPVSTDNGWQVLGDATPFPGISLMGNINMTAYLMDPNATQESSGNAIVAVEQGETLRTNTTGQLTAPARRVAMNAYSDRFEVDMSADWFSMFEAAIAWAGSDKAGMQIGLVVGDKTAALDDFDEYLNTTYLPDLGHSVVLVDDALDDPTVAAPNADLFIISSDVGSGNVGTKYTALPKPVLNYEYALRDEIGTGSQGVNVDMEGGEITAPGHPIAAGLSGPVVFTQGGPMTLSSTGDDVAPGGVVVATYATVVGQVIDSLAKADALKSGEIANAAGSPDSRTIPRGDIYDSGVEGGRWGDFDPVEDGNPGFFPPPLIPEGQTDYAVFNTGKLEITEERQYFFAISGNDGGRLRIDVDGNGFSDDDNVIVDDNEHLVTDAFGAIVLPIGTYDFEWTGFQSAGGATWELSVALDPVLEPGPLAGNDGSYFVGADLDAGFDGGPPRVVESRTISLSGADKSTLEASVNLAARPGGWEDNDFLRVVVDPDADGPLEAVTLAEFIGGGETGDLSDGVNALNETFQTLTYPLDGVIPNESTQMSIRIEALSSADTEILGFEDILVTGVVVAIPLAGDYNDNGLVEQSDLDLVLLNWGTDTPPIPAGWLSDPPSGQIDQAELDKVLLNWGQSATATAVTIPEPSACVLLVACALLMLGGRSS